MMYCNSCGNRIDNCICNTKMKSYKSIAKSIDELKHGEYFYTDQLAKQVFAVVSRTNKEWNIITKKCLVIDPKSGDILDRLTRVMRESQ